METAGPSIEEKDEAMPLDGRIGSQSGKIGDVNTSRNVNASPIGPISPTMKGALECLVDDAAGAEVRPQMGAATIHDHQRSAGRPKGNQAPTQDLARDRALRHFAGFPEQIPGSGICRKTFGRGCGCHVASDS